jgi:hypothetical protein
LIALQLTLGSPAFVIEILVPDSGCLDRFSRPVHRPVARRDQGYYLATRVAFSGLFELSTEQIFRLFDFA